MAAPIDVDRFCSEHFAIPTFHASTGLVRAAIFLAGEKIARNKGVILPNMAIVAS
jgi:hypothetical protein